MIIKWIVVIGVVTALALWVRHSKRKNVYSDPDVKEVDYRRYYVKAPQVGDFPSDDHQNDRY